jgi:hypothetical protein
MILFFVYVLGRAGPITILISLFVRNSVPRPSYHFCEGYMCNMLNVAFAELL